MADFPFPDQALAARSIIEAESGRWVVYLEATIIPDREGYIVRHRIADYPSQRHAEIAARWIVGAASRDLPRPQRFDAWDWDARSPCSNRRLTSPFRRRRPPPRSPR